MVFFCKFVKDKMLLMNSDFLTVSQYIECRQTLLDKITAINNLISAMELKLVDTVGQTNYADYNMDDGQMKVRAAYRSPSDVMAGITALEQLRQRYINRLNGRSRNLRGGNL